MSMKSITAPMSDKKAKHPFRLNGALRFVPFTPLDRLIESSVESLTGLKELDRRYQQMEDTSDHSVDAFLEQALKSLNIDYHIDAADVSHIPRHGPAIIVSNHPFGARDGLILAHILRSVRSDIKIIANHLLQRIPQLGDIIIPVNPFGGNNAARENVKPLRQAIEWVRRGGLLAVFPAGEVSSLRFSRMKVMDGKWQLPVARIIRHTRACVVPVYFEGGNSMLFHCAGMIHPSLRTALIPRELLSTSRRSVTVHAGKCIQFERIKIHETDRELLDFLRVCTYMLGGAHGDNQPCDETAGSQRDMETISPVSRNILHAEINALPHVHHLIAIGSLQVMYAHASQIPRVLQEIGRLREITFRATGEGTGKVTDIDLFDDYYLHLFIWNQDRREIVGAYRMGLADRILEKFNVGGLYTHTLFRYRRQLIARLNPAIELGRSFIREEYQRSYSALLLLWKGIGHFVARHPQYKVLFGPVSISNDYHTVSRQLMVDFLKANNFDESLSRHVKPRSPFRNAKPLLLQSHETHKLSDIDQVSQLIAALEKDGKGIPVLLRQYLKLGGELLGFNIDTEFNNSLDGLIKVDLTRTDTRILQKYMGRDGAAIYCDYHSCHTKMVS
jgi:putative hemolysin